MHRTSLLVLVLAGFGLTGSLTPLPAYSQSPEEELVARKLAGTWRVEVTLRDCNVGATRPPFHSLLTFGRDGTLTGTTANPSFQPGQRTPDHGVWSFAGGHTFQAVDEAFIVFDSPARTAVPAFRSGTQRINQTIELKNEDEFTSTASTSYFDSSGKLIAKGCASAVGRRLKLTP